jgi:hypothetical protein
VTGCCRLNEIRVLKVRLADMRRELHVLRTGVANVDVLKREVRPITTSGCLCHCNRIALSSAWPQHICYQLATSKATWHWFDAQHVQVYMSLCGHGCLCWDVCSLLVRVQVASLGRQLLQEHTKVKALSEELESPLNVHR